MWTLEVQYNGHFDLNTKMVYVDGNVVYFPQIDPNFMSIIELREIQEQLLLPIDMRIHYKVPDGEYRRVTNNDIVMEMFGMYRDTEYLVLHVGNVQFPNFWEDEEAAGVGHMDVGGNARVYEDSVAHSGDGIGESARATSSVSGVNTSELIDVLVHGDKGTGILVMILMTLM
ncbi:hypothetical protein ACH5RR_041776 [Cinchona calisaya]|uniref:PB1-like domain-containing protein n=1 Tax=Cinchona calisaya TaxID=153742 RepID=A0ABD2XXU8_9GENT